METSLFISIAYPVDMGLYVISLVTQLLKWTGSSRFVALCAVLVNGALLAVMAVSSHHLPVFNLFESLMLSTFVLGGLGVFSRPEKGCPWDARAWVWLLVLLLMGITLFFPGQASSYRPDSTFLWVVLFHGLRCLALGTGLFAVAHFMLFRFGSRALEKSLFLMGRNYLLVTTILFLCSEYAGMVWCQAGWGDFWHWSGTFFQSALIILCLMFAFHIPGKSRLSENTRSISGIVAVLIMLAVKIGKGLWMV